RRGHPRAAAGVEARGRGETRARRSGRDGRYRLLPLDAGRYRIEADDTRYVPYARTDVLVTAGGRAHVDLPLRLGASLSGRVVDEQGAPIAGAVCRPAAGDGRPGRRRTGPP